MRCDWIFASFTLLLMGCSHPPVSSRYDFQMPGENYLQNVRKVTSSGINLKANWSYDGEWLSFEKLNQNMNQTLYGCHQIYRIQIDGTQAMRISGERGNSKSPSNFPNDKRILFTSTLALREECPEEIQAYEKNLLSISYLNQIYGVYPDGRDIIPLEPGAPRAYNAEASICHNGAIVFTSNRGGDLQLYSAQTDSFGSFQNVQKITSTLGYRGGAQFSPDCKKITWHQSSPSKLKEKKTYQKLYEKQFVDLSKLEIWTANADGSDARPLTQLGVKSFNPTFSPDGNHVVFGSNLRAPKSAIADLYSIQLDGTGMEKISNSGGFDGYPAFSYDGKFLAFSSKRENRDQNDLNLFIAEWVPSSPPKK